MSARAVLLVVASLALPAVPAVADAPPPRAPRATLVEVLRGGKQVLLFDRASGDYAVKKLGDSIQGFRITYIEDDQIVLVGPGKPERHYVIPLLDRTPIPPMKAPPAAESELADPYGEPDAPAVKADAAADGGVMDPYGPAEIPAVVAPDKSRAGSPAASAGPAAPTSAPPAAATPTPAQAAPPATAARSEKRKLSRKELNKALSDFAALSREIKIERATGGGIAVTDLNKGSFVARIGIEKGDVVRRVAGHAIDTVDDAASAYAAVLAAKQVVVEIDRRGARHHITYQLTD